jgi:hypothetical protein
MESLSTTFIPFIFSVGRVLIIASPFLNKSPKFPGGPKLEDLTVLRKGKGKKRKWPRGRYDNA